MRPFLYHDIANRYFPTYKVGSFANLQNSNASFNATVRGSASSSSTMSYWASRQQRRPSDKPFEVSVDLSDPASSYFPTLDVGPDSVPKPESPHAHVELHAGAELPEAYGDGLVVGLDEELEPPPPRVRL